MRSVDSWCQWLILILCSFYIILYCVFSLCCSHLSERQLVLKLLLYKYILAVCECECERHKYYYQIYKSQLGTKAGWSCSASCPLLSVVSNGHCRRLPSYFPAITGSGVPRHVWPSPEGFEVQNFTTRRLYLGLRQAHAVYTPVSSPRNSFATPRLGL